MPNAQLGRGRAGGVAALASNGKVPASQIPAAAAGVPTGTILDYAGETAPDGWLVCDGRTVARASYPELSACLGELWNTGREPNGHVRLPDLTRRMTAGAGGSGPSDAVSAVGRTAGAERMTLDAVHMPEHSHAIDGSNTRRAGQISAAPRDSINYLVRGGGQATRTATAGQGQPFDLWPPVAFVTRIIRT